MDADPTDARPLLATGTHVEVRAGFDDTWSGGFVVEAHADGGYRLRRRSDDQVLPVVFSAEQVTRERNRSMWWY